MVKCIPRLRELSAPPEGPFSSYIGCVGKAFSVASLDRIHVIRTGSRRRHAYGSFNLLRVLAKFTLGIVFPALRLEKTLFQTFVRSIFQPYRVRLWYTSIPFR
jgi:hypothetical protein